MWHLGTECVSLKIANLFIEFKTHYDDLYPLDVR